MICCIISKKASCNILICHVPLSTQSCIFLCAKPFFLTIGLIMSNKHWEFDFATKTILISVSPFCHLFFASSSRPFACLRKKWKYKTRKNWHKSWNAKLIDTVTINFNSKQQTKRRHCYTQERPYQKKGNKK